MNSGKTILVLFFFFVLTTLFAQELTISDKIASRIAGPFHMRFILQPLMAIILGFRDGRKDAKTGTPPYLFLMLTDKGNRRQHFKKGIQALTTPLMIGILLDAIVQFNLFHKIHLYGAVLIGATLIGLPYTLSRGLTNRLSRKRIESV